MGDRQAAQGVGIALGQQAIGSVSLGNAQILYFAARGLVRCIGGVPNVEVARIWRSNDASASWVPRDGLPNGVCTPRTQWAAPTALASAARCSVTADSTLRRAITSGSGVKVALLGSLKPVPKMRL